MSFMETSMFGPLIWGSDGRPEIVDAARRAGWTRADIDWEALQERGNQALEEGKTGAAARHFRHARWIAALNFARGDLRRATSLANLAVIDGIRGRKFRSHARLAKALALWDRHAETMVQGMEIAPRARSSLFHLRMEALHRDTYQANMKHRIAKFAAETRESLQACLDRVAPPHRHFARWRGERPAVYDDTRKVLGACLLLAAALSH